MVKRMFLSYTAAFLILGSVAKPVPAQDAAAQKANAAPPEINVQSILELLEKAVSSIALRTRSAVVTIEDDRVLISFNAVPALKEVPLVGRLFQKPSSPIAAGASPVDVTVAGETPFPPAQETAKPSGGKSDPSAGEGQTVKPGQDSRIARQKLDMLYALSPPKSGSGFSIGDGYIVTTADVVDGMKNPLVITDNGTRIKAKLVGVNSDLNIGLLKLQAKADISTLKLGDSSSVAAGNFAISVGNQGGQINSVALMLVGGIRSEGTYSGNRFYPNLIQIAGTVGAGTSGAPLVNARGDVIGMMAAIPVNAYQVDNMSLSSERANIASRLYQSGSVSESAYRAAVDSKSGAVNPTPANPPISQQSFPIQLEQKNPYNDYFYFSQAAVTSAGFAVPINDIKPILEELKTGRPVVNGWIGIAPQDEQSAVESGGIVTVRTTVRIEGVFPDSPAIKSGVQPGDVLLSLNDKLVRNAADVREISVRLRLGNRLRMTIRRGDATQTYDLRIDARPAKIKPAITVPIKESF